MARDLYNLIWVTPPPPGPSIGPAPLQTDTTVARAAETTRGVIVFPAFMTPLVYLEGKDPEWLELILATELTLTPDMVNRQLKISLGLRGDKPYDPGPLFAGASGNIEVESIGNASTNRTNIIETHSNFAGILHPAFATALTNKRVGKLFKVKIKASAIPNSSPTNEQTYSHQENKFVGYRMNGTAVQRVTRLATVGDELSDVMIREMLTRRLGADNSSNPNTVPGRGRYAFPIRGTSIDMAQVDPQLPIQSYHPLIVHTGADSTNHLNLGHVSDIHVNSRWQILGKSNARVIEYGAGLHEDESPEIGSLLAENNRSFHAVLARLFGSAADAVIVGGDIVDHIRNAYDAARILSSANTPRQIWTAMDMDDPGYTESSYPFGLDLVAFYSFIYNSMTSSSKAVFGITGNHDCYVEAFGISPRIGAVVTSSRTNEGIPADLNLTFYEALLAFGPTGGLLRSASSSFSAEWFDWFHLVLSPFNDWWFKFPKQSLVGLGWGTTEDLIDPRGGQSGGHLPRSDDAISNAQLALLQRAVDARETRKVTLTTHFTFLSYIETVSMNPGGARSSAGTFRLNDNTLGTEDYSQFEMGTFETNRATLIEMLSNRQIQCIVSGHSHRRGMHLLRARAGDIIPADLYDTDPGNPLNMCTIPATQANGVPVIIVSDSAGPYPRHNRDGEFLGWGSDRPGATLIQFEAASGRLSQVRTLTATNRPKARGVVAMDYVDVSSTGAFNDNRLEVDWISGPESTGAAPPSSSPIYFVNANLSHQVHTTWQLYIERLVFAGFVRGSWVRIETSYDAGRNAFAVPAAQTADFRSFLRNAVTRFVSIKMGSRSGFISSRYDWTSFWNFEVIAQAIDRRTPGTIFDRQIGYRIFRPQRELEITGPNAMWREVPNFDWRMANDPKYA